MQTQQPSMQPSGDPVSLLAALSAGKKVAPDATDLLMQDHRQVMGWFRRYWMASEEGDRRQLVEQICLHLDVHMAFEEEVFYAAARELVDEPALLDHAEEEHDEARTIVQALQKDAGPGDQRDQLIARLETAIIAHVSQEEDVLFPQVRASGVDLYELGRSLAAARVQEMSLATGKPIPFGSQ
jgi:iron-sulfur cluster repair protein YtfE (RIC family)